jgi:LPS-assembly lipoprotein
MSWSRQAAIALALLVLAGCGFHPLHAQRAGDGSTVGNLAQVKIALIDNRIGQELRNELLNRLNPDGSPRAPRYTLQVKLEQTESALAIDEAGTASRSSLSVTATYKLISLDNGTPLLQGTSTSINSYSIITNSYATLVGQKDAQKRTLRAVADDIALRLSLYFRDHPSPPQ